MIAMRNLAVMIMACAPVSGFRHRHTAAPRAGDTDDPSVPQSWRVPPEGAEGPAQTPALTQVEYQRAAEASDLTGRLGDGTSVQFFGWFTDRLKDVLAHIAEVFHGFLDALLDIEILSQIVDYIVDSSCDSGNSCPLSYATCVSAYSKEGHSPISSCDDIVSDEGVGWVCGPGNLNVFGYKPCKALFTWWPEDEWIQDQCIERCPSSLHWGDAVRLPEICALYKDTLCPALQSEERPAWRNALKDFAREALHPDAWIPRNSTGSRTLNGWMALSVRALVGVGIGPVRPDPTIYRGIFPELYRYKDCLAANNNVHEVCEHHVEYDENPALKSQAAWLLTVTIQGYNYQNACRGEDTGMANFPPGSLGVDFTDMSNFCKQGEKSANAEHDAECVGIAGNVPLSRPKEPVGNLEKSSCHAVNWEQMVKVYDAELGICVGRDAYAPLKVWKHEGLLSDSQVGLYMTEEGPNKVKLTLNCRGSEIPDISKLPEALTSDAFDANALWRQLPETVKDWLFTDASLFPRDDSVCGNANVRMHNGFQNAYKTFKAHTKTLNPTGQSYLDEVAAIISAKMAVGKEVELYISGHSLGGGIAVLMAYDIYCHQADSAHSSLNSVLSFSKDSAANKATGPFLMTFGEAPVWYGKKSAAAFATAVPSNVHMRINTCGLETNMSSGETFYGGDLVGLAMDYSTDDDQGFRRRADGSDFQCAWVSKTFFARTSSTGLDDDSMIENSTVISPESVNRATSSRCAGLMTVGGSASLLDSAIFCHFTDRYFEGLTNDRPVDNNIAASNSSLARKSLFHNYNRPKAETRATCQDLGTYSYEGESYPDVPRALGEYALRNVVSDVANLPLGELFDRIAERTQAAEAVLGEIQAKGEELKRIAEGLFGV